MQCTPPLCSARCKEAHRASADFKKSCQLSEQAFSAAAVVLPREWVFELYLGKLCVFLIWLTLHDTLTISTPAAHR